MLIENGRPSEITSSRRWNPAVLPRGFTVLALAVCLCAARAGIAAAPNQSEGTGPTAKASDDSNDEKESSTPRAKGEPNRLSYHDGTADGKKSLGGSGEMIHFELLGDGGKVASVRIHGSRYGYPQPPKESFSISFLNDDMSEVVATQMAPYSLFKKGPETWVQIKFSMPIAVPKNFWIVVDFHAEKTKGVFVSYDKSTGGIHSRVGLPGMEAKQTDFDGDWMIEVVLAK
jgi:hypothetical protein